MPRIFDGQSNISPQSSEPTVQPQKIERNIEGRNVLDISLRPKQQGDYQLIGFDPTNRRNINIGRAEYITDGQLVNTEQEFPDIGISGNKISELTVDKLRTQTIFSQQITLGVVDGEGDVYIAAGEKDDFTTDGSGFIMGIDDSDGNKAKIIIGEGDNSLVYEEGGDLIVNGVALTLEAFYGDGSDGDITYALNSTLSRDMFYNNLTINSGVELDTSSYRIFVKGTLTNNGTISNNGNNGGNGGDASGTTPGTAGGAGASLASGSLKDSVAGVAGAVGGAAGIGAANGGAGGNGTDGTDVAKIIGVDGQTGSDSSVGGNSDTNNGGAGATKGAAGVGTGTVYNIPRNYVGAYNLFDVFPSTTLLGISAGSGSGASGPGGAGNATGNGGAGGGSGGSGSSAGIVWIFAKELINNGDIEAIGGNAGSGGDGGDSTVPASGFCGGGSGGSAGGPGSGGVIFLGYSIFDVTGTLNVNAGAIAFGGLAGDGFDSGGVNVSPGSNGTASPLGMAGKIYQFKI